MRQITTESVEAFLCRQSFSKANMRVDVNNGVAKLYLHNNCIGINDHGDVSISNAGWPSNTTKERLNGILTTLGKSGIYQKAFIWWWENGLLEQQTSTEFINDRFYKIYK